MSRGIHVHDINRFREKYTHSCYVFSYYSVASWPLGFSTPRALYRMLYREQSARRGMVKKFWLGLTLAWVSHCCVALLISRRLMSITLEVPPSDFLPSWLLLNGIHRPGHFPAFPSPFPASPSLGAAANLKAEPSLSGLSACRASCRRVLVRGCHPLSLHCSLLWLTRVVSDLVGGQKEAE